jgi:hypothetical protein
MRLALYRRMSALDALHDAAPSLKQRRTHSQAVVVETRRRLAQSSSRELAAISEPVASAEIFFDENLTVEEEAGVAKRAKLVAVVVFGMSCGAALASIVLA